MAKRGILKLYSYDGSLLRTVKYFRNLDRVEILENWRKEYGHRFSQCYYHIIPNLETRKTDYKKRKLSLCHQ